MNKLNTLNNYLFRNEYASKFWCALFFAHLIFGQLNIWRLSNKISQGILFAVIDDGTFYLTKSLQFNQLGEQHEEQARLATEVLFERGPLGLDSETRLERLFQSDARNKALRMALEETQYFRERNMHQKLKDVEVEILKMRDHSVRVLVTGELIRMGEFSGELIAESLQFEARFNFALNKDMLRNGQYPTVVRDFTYKIEPVIQL